MQDQKPNKPKLINLQQAAKFLKVSDDTAARFLKKNEKTLSAHKVGREWRVSEKKLVEYMAGE